MPFHAWTPEVYEGAPTPVTAFMAAGVKTAGFALLARLFLSAQGPGTAGGSFGSILSVLAVLTVTFGNLAALPQRSVKRMLAYSSIAHAGYLLIGVLAAKVDVVRGQALSGLLFYLAAYTATAIGAFGVVAAIEKNTRGEDEPQDAWDLSRFAGLGRRSPPLAFAMAVFMLSLAGVPGTAGFMAKLYLFRAAIGAQLYGLALVGILTSILGAYYYLRVIVYMYMKPAEGDEDAAISLAEHGGGADRRGGAGRHPGALGRSDLPAGPGRRGGHPLAGHPTARPPGPGTPTAPSAIARRRRSHVRPWTTGPEKK